MPDQDFTNREINQMFQTIEHTLDGKVADIQQWREQVNGGAKVAAFFLAVLVVPILGWAIYVLSHIESIVHQSIDEALSAYEIEK